MNLVASLAFLAPLLLVALSLLTLTTSVAEAAPPAKVVVLQLDVFPGSTYVVSPALIANQLPPDPTAARLHIVSGDVRGAVVFRDLNLHSLLVDGASVYNGANVTVTNCRFSSPRGIHLKFDDLSKCNAGYPMASTNSKVTVEIKKNVIAIPGEVSDLCPPELNAVAMCGGIVVDPILVCRANNAGSTLFPYSDMKIEDNVVSIPQFVSDEYMSTQYAAVLVFNTQNRSFELFPSDAAALSLIGSLSIRSNTVTIKHKSLQEEQWMFRYSFYGIFIASDTRCEPAPSEDDPGQDFALCVLDGDGKHTPSFVGSMTGTILFELNTIDILSKNTVGIYSGSLGRQVAGGGVLVSTVIHFIRNNIKLQAQFTLQGMFVDPALITGGQFKDNAVYLIGMQRSWTTLLAGILLNGTTVVGDPNSRPSSWFYYFNNNYFSIVTSQSARRYAAIFARYMPRTADTGFSVTAFGLQNTTMVVRDPDDPVASFAVLSIYMMDEITTLSISGTRIDMDGNMDGIALRTLVLSNVQRIRGAVLTDHNASVNRVGSFSMFDVLNVQEMTTVRISTVRLSLISIDAILFGTVFFGDLSGGLRGDTMKVGLLSMTNLSVSAVHPGGPAPPAKDATFKVVNLPIKESNNNNNGEPLTEPKSIDAVELSDVTIRINGFRKNYMIGTSGNIVSFLIQRCVFELMNAGSAQLILSDVSQPGQAVAIPGDKLLLTRSIRISDTIFTAVGSSMIGFISLNWNIVHGLPDTSFMREVVGLHVVVVRSNINLRIVPPPGSISYIHILPTGTQAFVTSLPSFIFSFGAIHWGRFTVAENVMSADRLGLFGNSLVDQVSLDNSSERRADCNRFNNLRFTPQLAKLEFGRIIPVADLRAIFGPGTLRVAAYDGGACLGTGSLSRATASLSQSRSDNGTHSRELTPPPTRTATLSETRIPIPTFDQPKALVQASSAVTSLAAAGALLFGGPAVALDAGRALSLLGTVSRCEQYAKAQLAAKTDAERRAIESAFVEQFLTRSLSFPESLLPGACLGPQQGQCLRGAVLGGFLLLVVVFVCSLLFGVVVCWREAKQRQEQQQQHHHHRQSPRGRRSSNNGNSNNSSHSKVPSFTAWDVVRRARLPYTLIQATAVQLSTWSGHAVALLITPTHFSGISPADRFFYGALVLVCFWLVPAAVFCWFLQQHALSRAFLDSSSSSRTITTPRERRAKNELQSLCTRPMTRADAFQLEEVVIWSRFNATPAAGGLQSKLLRLLRERENSIVHWMLVPTHVWSQGSTSQSVANGEPGSFLQQVGTVVSKQFGPLHQQQPQQQRHQHGIRTTPRNSRRAAAATQQQYRIDLGEFGRNIDDDDDSNGNNTSAFFSLLRTKVSPFTVFIASLFVVVAATMQTVAALHPHACRGALIAICIVCAVALVFAIAVRPFLLPVMNWFVAVSELFLVVAAIVAVAGGEAAHPLLTISIVAVVLKGFSSGLSKVAPLLGVAVYATRAQAKQLQRDFELEQQRELNKQRREEEKIAEITRSIDDLMSPLVLSPRSSAPVPPSPKQHQQQQSQLAATNRKGAAGLLVFDNSGTTPSARSDENGQEMLPMMLRSSAALFPPSRRNFTLAQQLPSSERFGQPRRRPLSSERAPPQTAALVAAAVNSGGSAAAPRVADWSSSRLAHSSNNNHNNKQYSSDSRNNSSSKFARHTL